jgi:hypothetical protein
MKAITRLFRIQILSAVLSGCVGESAFLLNEPPAERQPNFRAIIVESLRIKSDIRQNVDAQRKAGQDSNRESDLNYFVDRGGIFPPKTKIDDVNISDAIRMVQTNTHGWAWLTCMRLNANGSPVTYAVFITGNHVVDARIAVAIDNCDQGNYAPLIVSEAQSSANKKVPKKPRL